MAEPVHPARVWVLRAVLLVGALVLVGDFVLLAVDGTWDQFLTGAGVLGAVVGYLSNRDRRRLLLGRHRSDEPAVSDPPGNLQL